MSVYQHILAAVDLGDNSAKVLQQSAALAQLCDARLTVLLVVNYTPSSDIDYVIAPNDETAGKLIEAARNQLHELLEREALTRGVGTIVNTGRPKFEIVRTAKKENVDLIVIGAHGRHGLAGLLGSTANRVLDQATCNVMVVH